MGTDNVILRESLTEAKFRSLTAYRHARQHTGAGRAAAFALGRYEGLSVALELLRKELRREPPSEPSAREGLTSLPITLAPFSSIFQKFRPKHGPSPFGRW